MPCLAVQLVRPWTLVLVDAGSSDATWRGEFAALAVDVALRACGADHVPLVVFGDEGAVRRRHSATSSTTT